VYALKRREVETERKGDLPGENWGSALGRDSFPTVRREGIEASGLVITVE
jgi:hypothetical protein